ncbi:MAG: reductive dehalogenase [Eubacteriaceae bacterium]|nr:reductive dehalogenase [Eubacteriaceae bacterium]
MIPRTEMEISKEPYSVDHTYKRFPVYKEAFVTVSFQDTGKMGYMLFLGKMLENMAKKIALGEEGYSQADNALDMGANTLNLLLGTYGFPNSQFLRWSPLFVPEMFAKKTLKLESEKLTEMVKQAAALYGADLTGIAGLDSRWVYSHDLVKPFKLVGSGEPEETETAFLIPERVNRAIVMAVAMDAELIEASPTVPGSTAASLGYSRMGIAAVSLAEFIRALGYTAIPCMNDTALSIPLAVDAGLGELGRHGLLITPEYGSNIRLCKVLTDMPLLPDVPIDFGVAAFCDSCLLCAKNCPSAAISTKGQITEGVCGNNNPGVKKWYINGERCLKFWQANGASCANCIAVCPFTTGFESMQCYECEKCDPQRRCELQVNTHLRMKYGYLKGEVWGNKPRVVIPGRRGL